MWDTCCRKGRQESNISLWDVVLEKAASDIIKRSHHQWTYTVPYWQIPTTNYQDWSAQAKILWSCLQKGRRPLWKKKKKVIIQGTFKGIHRNRKPKLRWSDGLKKITGHSLTTSCTVLNVTDAGGMVSFHGSQRVSSDLKVTTTTKPRGRANVTSRILPTYT